eukprot:scaffold76472_cov33-Phaeocystis_antarctica.AAC.1
MSSRRFRRVWERALPPTHRSRTARVLRQCEIREVLVFDRSESVSLCLHRRSHPLLRSCRYCMFNDMRRVAET